MGDTTAEKRARRWAERLGLRLHKVEEGAYLVLGEGYSIAADPNHGGMTLEEVLSFLEGEMEASGERTYATTRSGGRAK